MIGTKVFYKQSNVRTADRSRDRSEGLLVIK